MASINGTMKRSASTTPGVTTLHLGIGDLALHQVPIKSAPFNSSGLYSLLLQAQLRILNPYETTSELYRYLSTLALPSLHRLRPSWETYFLSLCTLASLRSNCMKRRVGAVLVRNNRVLSTGYNGTPRGLVNCNEGGCPRCNASATLGTKLDECCECALAAA
jgi:dCMP deaminase